jgi:hypothetical protein
MVEELTEGIVPKNIAKLSKRNGHYKFFNNNFVMDFAMKAKTKSEGF